MNESLFINGPVNAIRLHGTINGRSKIIYLFMDIHNDPHAQTECHNIKNIDIKNYLVHNFDQLRSGNKTFDFLFEIKPTLISQKTTNIRGRYIDQVVKLFKKEFNLSANKLVSSSKQFPNLRLHSIDIRDYLKHTFSANMYSLINFVNTIWKRLYMTTVDLKSIRNTITVVSSRIRVLYNDFYKNNNDNNISLSKSKPIIPKSVEELLKYTEQDFDSRSKSIIDQMLHDYHHPQVQHVITQFINTNIKDSFNHYFSAADNISAFIDSVFKSINKYGDTLTISKVGATYGTPAPQVRSMIKRLYDHTEELYFRWMNLHSNIMDAFFLRRFLDKDYITNGITYTGIYHSINYIFVLVKFFDFDITHFSHMKYDLNTTIKHIKRAKSSYSLQTIFYPPTFIQCSDMSSFPKNFE